ncbi:MAG: FAD:protein FMN transferase, partial [Deltaproteobacteria bacterium]|nr:FAD:protein FMN transferase [Deltaproteobacteria bacterium]
LKISLMTNGAYDITVRPLGKLWDVRNRKSPPSQEEIETARKLVNYRKLLIDSSNNTIFLRDPGMAFGFGSIAKGYAAKRAGMIFKANGINDFIIDAGGDLYFEGSKGATHWVSGIRDPDPPHKVMLPFKLLTSCSVATSGDYERYFEYKGRRYHHIIDPATGYPAFSGLRSVTVFSKDPMLADAYATAFFVMGPERANKLVSKGMDLSFIMVKNDGSLIKSRGLDLFIKPSN